MTVGLGIAFKNRPIERVTVAIVQGPAASATQEALASSKSPERFEVAVVPENEARRQLRTGRTDVVVAPENRPANGDGAPRYVYHFDPTRSESVLARNAVDDQLQRAAGRRDVAEITVVEMDEPGGRYIDFLVPGLLGMSLMGGGLWGVGFVTVDMRVRKLLKRFLATPMKKTDFLMGIMISRMLFMVPEVLALLVFARYAFGVVNHGSSLAVTFLILLRSVMLEGASLGELLQPIAIMTAWSVVSFVLALRWFRWRG
jgi:ABC-type multidrug transport system permease subunit